MDFDSMIYLDVLAELRGAGKARHISSVRSQVTPQAEVEMSFQPGTLKDPSSYEARPHLATKGNCGIPMDTVGKKMKEVTLADSP
jgi:hypothetical protein